MKATTLVDLAESCDREEEDAPHGGSRQRRDSLDFPHEVSPELFLDRISEELFLSRPSDAGAGDPSRRPVARGRRILTRVVAYSVVVAALGLVALIAQQPRGLNEMATWGTLGNPAVASTAARGVTTLVESLRGTSK